MSTTDEAAVPQNPQAQFDAVLAELVPDTKVRGALRLVLIEAVNRSVKRARAEASPLVLRAQAAQARAQGDLLRTAADAAERMADAIEQGEVEPPTGRMRIVADASEAEDRDEQPRQVTRVEDRHGAFRCADGEPLSPHMAQFVSGFADRFVDSPHFIDVVNAAAERGLVLDEDTRHWIGAEIQEREAQVRSRAADAEPVGPRRGSDT